MPPRYAECTNPDCGWKRSCHEFFSREACAPGIDIPPHIKCACGCYRAQHLPRSEASIPAPASSAPPRAPQNAPASSLPNVTPGGFTNRFTSAATAQERLGVVSGQRINAFDPLMAGISPATSSGNIFTVKRGRKPGPRSNSVLEPPSIDVTILFLRDTTAIDAWKFYDPDNFDSEPVSECCTEPTDASYPVLVHLGLTCALTVSKTWTPAKLSAELRQCIETNNVVSACLLRVSKTWKEVRLCLAFSRGGRRACAMVPNRTLECDITVDDLLKCTRKRSLNGDNIRALYLALPEGSGLLQTDAMAEISRPQPMSGSWWPSDLPLLSDSESDDSSLTPAANPLPSCQDAEPVMSHVAAEGSVAHDVNFMARECGDLERTIMFLNLEAGGPPSKSDMDRHYTPMRVACVNAEKLIRRQISMNVLRFSPEKKSTSVDEIFTIIKNAIMRTRNLIGLCEVGYIRFHAGKDAFGSAISLSLLVPKWFPICTLDSDKQTELCHGFEGICRQLTMLIGAHRNSLQRMDCDPPQYAVLLDALNMYDHECLLAQENERLDVIDHLQDLSHITTKDLRTKLTESFGRFDHPSGIHQNSLVLGVHGLHAFYSIVIGTFLDKYDKALPDFIEKQVMLKLFCENMATRLHEANVKAGKKRMRESPPSAPSGSEGHSSDNEVPPAKRTRMSREPPKDPGTVPKAGMSTPSQPPQTSPPTETDSAKRLRLFKSMTDRRFIAVLASDYAPPIAPASHGPNLSVEALMEMKSRQRYNALRMAYHPDRYPPNGNWPEGWLSIVKDITIEINRRASN